MSVGTSIKHKLHYGWVIFGLTFANLTAEGGAKNSQPVFLLALRNGFGALASSDIRLLGPQKLLKLRERPARGFMLDATAARKPLNVLSPQVGDALLAPSLQVLEHAQHAVIVHGAPRHEASRCDGGTVRVLLELETDLVTNSLQLHWNYTETHWTTLV